MYTLPTAIDLEETERLEAIERDRERLAVAAEEAQSLAHRLRGLGRRMEIENPESIETLTSKLEEFCSKTPEIPLPNYF